MKSAIGIGALLMDGLGDTIRVSLTEDPEKEIDPCRHAPSQTRCTFGNYAPVSASDTWQWMMRKRASCLLHAVSHSGTWSRRSGCVGGGPDGLTRRRARRQLVALGARAMEGGWGVEPYGESGRDIHTFARRVGRLPEQRPGDALDYRPLLHRDGSVLSALALEVGAVALPWVERVIRGLRARAMR